MRVSESVAKFVDPLFIFKVHQPYRLEKGFFWERKMFRKLTKEKLFDFCFDSAKNREIFEHAFRKCYFPSNSVLLGLIDEFKKEKKKSRCLSAYPGFSLVNAKCF
jgi:hypothetical protein